MTDFSDGLICWYDLETTGIEPCWHRILQFAAQKTTPDLTPVGEPINFHVRLPVDVLPDPAACCLTGLTPQAVNEQGITELEAMHRIYELFMEPGTCVAGFNSIRFDDEFVRYGFYRNLLPVYLREYQNGNTRWDILELCRAAAALRPEGMEWPTRDGAPVFNLGALAEANGIDVNGAHEAGTDVELTIALARLLRQNNEKLYDFAFSLRRRPEVEKLMRTPNEILVLVAGSLPRDRKCLGLVMQVGRSPKKNMRIVADLGADVSCLIEWPDERLADVWWNPDGDDRLPLRPVQINKSPFIAPVSVLRPEDTTRLGIDMQLVGERREYLLKHKALLEKRIAALFRAEAEPQVQDRRGNGRARSKNRRGRAGKGAERNFNALVGPDGRILANPESNGTKRRTPVVSKDVEAQLYTRFISERDQSEALRVAQALRQANKPGKTNFADRRLRELLGRLKARNDLTELMSDQERREWRGYVKQKLLGNPPETDTYLTLEAFRQRISEVRAGDAIPANEEVLAALEDHGDALHDSLVAPR